MRMRRERTVPGLNTASLPDLIFTVLFFFMLVTQMRDVELKVEYQLPQGTEIEKLTKRSTVAHIYVGRLPDGETTAIQINDKLATVDDIGRLIGEERRRMAPADREKMAVSIVADKDAKMGLISDIKMQLRRVNALRIIYSAEEAEE